MDIMPKYDYACPEGKMFYECPGEEEVVEYDLSFEHEPPACVVCGAKMRRIYSATPAIFKGRGWGSKP